MKKIRDDYYVFYLTKERQGLYLGNKLIKTVEEVQGKVKQITIFDLLKK